MKNYRWLVPLVLVVLFFASFYSLYDTKAEKLNNYEQNLADARRFRELDIQVDAEASYLKALEMVPSLELSIEIGEFYEEIGQDRKAETWAESILVLYPKEVAGYEYRMKQFFDNKDYIACYNLAYKFNKIGLVSEYITSCMEEIEYEFYFRGEYLDIGVFSNGMCAVLSENGWGYVNTVGLKVIASAYLEAGEYSDQLSPVIDKEGKAFYIDEFGNKKFVIINIENVIELGLMENGIYSLYNGTDWGFYDREYNLLFGGFEEVSSIGNGVAAVKKNGQWSLMDGEGNDLTGKTYSAVAMDEKKVVYRNDRIFVKDGDNYKMIDRNGNVCGDLSFQAVHVFNDTTYAAVMINDKWGFVDAEGKIIFDPQYEDARSFSNGYAAVCVEDKWGFIDASGEIVIEPQFENAKDFNNHGCAFVCKDSAWTLLRLYKDNYREE